jgi:hypothetical protein
MHAQIDRTGLNGIVKDPTGKALQVRKSQHSSLQLGCIAKPSPPQKEHTTFQNCQ